MNSPTSLRRVAGGFGLLEIMLSLAILAAIAGTVFMLAQISVQLSSSVVGTQREAMHQQAFFDLLKKQFAELPGNAVVDLTFQDPPGQGPYLSQMTFQNVPLIFSWGGNQMAVKAVQIDTVIRRDGFLDIVLKYYDVEILDESNETNDGNQEDVDGQAEPIATIVLLEGVRWFEWQVLDSRTGEWLTEWQNPSRQPTLIQLDVAFGGGEENLRQIFWIPPKQNPVTLMRQLRTNRRTGSGANGGGSNGGDGGDGGDVPVPGVGGGGASNGGGNGVRPPGGVPTPALPENLEPNSQGR